MIVILNLNLDISRVQDDEVGDGTTSVVVFSGELLKEAEKLIATTIHPMTIISGRPIIVDFSPVTDFCEAICRQYEENVCNRGGYYNFMHLKKISCELRHQLFWRYR